MRKPILYATFVGLVLVSTNLANAQTTVTLTSSNQDIIFASGTTSGAQTVQLGSCASGITGTLCTLNGSASGGTSASYQILTLGTVGLTSGPSGTFTATSGLTGSTVTISNSSSVVVFQGTLSSLTFTQSAAQVTSGQVTMTASSAGTGAFSGVTVTLTGTIQLPTGSNLTTLAASTNVSGRFTGGGAIPEPSSMLLMGSGLVTLGGFLRRRLRKG